MSNVKLASSDTILSLDTGDGFKPVAKISQEDFKNNGVDLIASAGNMTDEQWKELNAFLNDKK